MADKELCLECKRKGLSPVNALCPDCASKKPKKDTSWGRDTTWGRG